MSKMHRIYFYSPKKTVDMDTLAERLIALDSVQEVFLTDINNGYVAKIRFFDGEDSEDPATYLSRNLDSAFGNIVKA